MLNGLPCSDDLFFPPSLLTRVRQIKSKKANIKSYFINASGKTDITLIIAFSIRNQKSGKRLYKVKANEFSNIPGH